MQKIKYTIPVILLLIIIGFAAISTSLGIGGKTYITSDIDDFKVYYSKVLIDGEVEETAILDSTTINYTRTLTNIGEGYTITYDVTNASKEFDAEISINCTTGDEYLSVTNSFDVSILPARTTRTGTLTVKKTKSNYKFRTMVKTQYYLFHQHPTYLQQLMRRNFALIVLILPFFLH